MSAVPKQKFSIEEYIEFDKNNEGRWEYFDGEVFDMAGGSLNHNQIISNLTAALARKLRENGCRIFPTEMRVKVPNDLPYRYPDVTVVCDKPIIEKLQGQEMLVNPLLLIEVLSPTTEGYDHGQKFIAYQSIPSFREYLLVAQDRPHITHYVRQSDGNWLRRDIEGVDSVVKLTSVECELTLAEVYRLVEFSSGDSQPSAE
ncbi:MAG: Uma2 family endonuclease [Blastocatellales bacterium]